MGNWGIAISSNDTYADVYAAFFDLYNAGKEIEDISKELIDNYAEEIKDEDDSDNFWFALAKAQWECKQLDTTVLEKVTEIIESGQNIETWRRLGTDESDIAKRKIVLDKFLSELRTEKAVAKKRKKKVVRRSPFEKGDCIVFKLANGNYGGAVVLEVPTGDKNGYSLIVTTRLNQSAKPTKNDLEAAEALILNYGNWDNKLCIQWYAPIRHKMAEPLIETVAKIEIAANFDIRSTTYGFAGDFADWIIGVADMQFKYEESNSRPTEKKTISDLVGNT